MSYFCQALIKSDESNYKKCNKQTKHKFCFLHSLNKHNSDIWMTKTKCFVWRSKISIDKWNDSKTINERIDLLKFDFIPLFKEYKSELFLPKFSEAAFIILIKFAEFYIYLDNNKYEINQLYNTIIEFIEEYYYRDEILLFFSNLNNKLNSDISESLKQGILLIKNIIIRKTIVPILLAREFQSESLFYKDNLPLDIMKLLIQIISK